MAGGRLLHRWVSWTVCLLDVLWENLTLVLEPEPVKRKMGEERIEWISLQKKVSLLLGVLVHAFNPNTYEVEAGGSL